MWFWVQVVIDIILEEQWLVVCNSLGNIIMHNGKNIYLASTNVMDGGSGMVGWP